LIEYLPPERKHASLSVEANGMRLIKNAIGASQDTPESGFNYCAKDSISSLTDGTILYSKEEWWIILALVMVFAGLVLGIFTFDPLHQQLIIC
jgi:hypothetical protein